MKLNTYLSDTGTPVRIFAERAGVSIPTVYAWLSGRNIPNRELMLRIYESTGGAVTANDFFNVSALPDATVAQTPVRVESDDKGNNHETP